MWGQVLIVDDHAGFRAVARTLLEASGFAVVGEAADGSSAVGAVRSLQPDLVLLDVHLPDVDGCEVSKQLASERPRPVVVLISSREAADFGRRIEACGAHGFLAKSELTGAALVSLMAGA